MRFIRNYSTGKKMIVWDSVAMYCITASIRQCIEIKSIRPLANLLPWNRSIYPMFERSYGMPCYGIGNYYEYIKFCRRNSRPVVYCVNGEFGCGFGK